MSKIHPLIFLLALVTVGSAHAQAPTGNIDGVVTDSVGAHVAGVRVIIINRDSGLTRHLTTSTAGDYSGHNRAARRNE